MALTVPVDEIVANSKNPLLTIRPGWKRICLGEIASVLNGFAFKSSQFTKDGKMPLVRIRDVGSDSTDTNYIGDFNENYIVEPGDLLIGMDGDFNCARWKGPRGLLNQRVCKVTLQSDEYHPHFLDYALPGYLKAINDATSSVTVKHLSSRSVEEIPLPFPPRAEQQEIVVELEKQFSRLDEAVANLKRVKANLKRYKATVLKAAVEGKLTENWRKQHPDVEPASKLLDRILTERRTKWQGKGKYKEAAVPDTRNLPPLPKRWTWASVEQIASSMPRSIQSGPFGSNLLHSEFQGTGVLVIGIDNVLEGRFTMGSQNRISLGKYKVLEKYAARPLDILITVMATVGRVCVVPADLERAIITKHVYRISGEERLISPHYLMLCLWGGAEVRNQLFSQVKGQTRPGINGEILRGVVVPVPPIGEQHCIIGEVERRLSVTEELEATVEANLKRADRLRQSILSKAFSGRLIGKDTKDIPGTVPTFSLAAERQAGMEKTTA